MSDDIEARHLFAIEAEDTLQEDLLEFILDVDADSQGATARIADKKSRKQYIREKLVKWITEPSRVYICDKLKYCERINSQEVNLAIDIANAISTAKITLITGFPVPALKIAVYLVKNRIMNPLCKCE